MNWIFDQPVALVLLSVAVLTGLGISWVMSGHKALLYGLVGAAVVAALLLVVERMVITDREAIETTLQQMARDVASNQPAKVTQHISSSAPLLQQKATTELPNYKFDSMRITKVHKIEVHADRQPRTATVEFNVVAEGTFKEGSDVFADTKIPRWVQLELVKEADEQWRIRDYEHDEPQRMMIKNIDLSKGLPTIE